MKPTSAPVWHAAGYHSCFATLQHAVEHVEDVAIAAPARMPDSDHDAASINIQGIDRAVSLSRAHEEARGVRDVLHSFARHGRHMRR